MPLIVTGISPAGEVRVLERSLGEAHLPLDRLQVIEPSDATPRIAAHGLAGAGGLLGGLETGTGVPGLTGPGTVPGGAGTPFFRDESLTESLSGLEIPEDEIDNYFEALEAGRTVVAYVATAETLATVKNLFEAAGLAKVKVF